jgi:hypothetical protein
VLACQYMRATCRTAAARAGLSRWDARDARSCQLTAARTLSREASHYVGSIAHWQAPKGCAGQGFYHFTTNPWRMPPELTYAGSVSHGQHKRSDFPRTFPGDTRGRRTADSRSADRVRQAYAVVLWFLSGSRGII